MMRARISVDIGGSSRPTSHHHLDQTDVASYHACTATMLHLHVRLVLGVWVVLRPLGELLGDDELADGHLAGSHTPTHLQPEQSNQQGGISRWWASAPACWVLRRAWLRSCSSTKLTSENLLWYQNGMHARHDTTAGPAKFKSNQVSSEVPLLHSMHVI